MLLLEIFVDVRWMYMGNGVMNLNFSEALPMPKSACARSTISKKYWENVCVCENYDDQEEMGKHLVG